MFYTAYVVAQSALFSRLFLVANSVTDIIVGSACNGSTALGCPASGKTDAFALFRGGVMVFLGVLAAASVLMVVLGGLRYVLSGGDSAGIRAAKDTIVYAIAGLTVAILSFIIISFVISRIG